MVFTNTIWWLWKWRNSRCFGRVADIPVDQMGFIMSRVGLIRHAFDREELEEGRSKRRRVEIFVRWLHPDDGWVRLNTDGAAKGNPGAAGAGGIIRGHSGELFEMFAANCGYCSSTRAELLAVVRGLVVAWNGGHRRIQLTVDSEVVVRALVDEVSPTSPFYHIIKKCKELVSRAEWRVSIQHCYREANRAADWLANYGVGLSPKMVLLEAAPAGLRAVLLEDLSGVALARMVPAVAA